MNTSKWLSLGQTIFYGAITLILPQLISDIGASGAIFGISIPWGLTGALLWILNQLENSMAADGKGHLFGLAN